MPTLFAFTAPVALALSAAATAPETPMTTQEAFASLDGKWEGSLAYRDYQSQKLEKIPVALTMETQPDGETMVQRYNYSDPGFQVYVTNLITVRGGVLAGAMARAGRAFETYEKTITVTQHASLSSWTVVLDDETKDDNRPARVRETMVRADDSLSVVKQVDYLDDDKEEWIFRNEITLSAVS